MKNSHRLKTYFHTLACAAILVLSPLYLTAQEYKAQPVKDVWSGVGTGYPKNSEALLHVLNGKAYFRGNTVNSGAELFVTDGSENGTKMVADIYNGYFSGLPAPTLSIPSKIWRNKLYLNANGASVGEELYCYDIATDSMRLLFDLRSGSNGSKPHNFIEIGNHLLFEAFGTSTQQFLYALDSNNVLDTLEDWYIQPCTPVHFGKEVAFLATKKNTSGFRLLFIDGNLNTREVVLSTASAFYSPPEFLAAGKHLYFLMDEGVGGRELYVYSMDSGVVKLKDVTPTNYTSSGVEILGNLGDDLVYLATDSSQNTHVYKAKGTSMVSLKEWKSSEYSDFNEVVHTDSALYFTITLQSVGHELWKTDGSTSGTSLVKDIYQEPANQKMRIDIQNLYVASNRILFSANDGIHGYELWETDGSSSGTKLVLDVNDKSPTNNNSSSPYSIFEMNDEIYFGAYMDGLGNELHKLIETVNFLDLGKDTSGCGRVVLSANVNVSNPLWSTGDTSATLSVDTTGWYWLEAENANGKKDRDNIFVEIFEFPSAVITKTAYGCDSAVLDVSGSNLSYSWSTGDTTQSIVLTESNFGITLEVENANGCKTSLYESVNIPDPPTVDLGEGDAACGQKTYFLPKDTNLSYVWSNSETENTTIYDSTQWVRVQVTNKQTRCSAEDSTYLVVHPFPEVRLVEDTSGCDSVLLEPEGGENLTYNWSDGSNGNSLWVKERGNQTVYLNIENEFGCESTYETTIELEKTPELDSIQILFDLEYILSAEGVQYADSILWDLGDGTKDTGEVVTKTYPDGRYTIRVTVKNACRELTKERVLQVGNISAGSMELSAFKCYPNPFLDALFVQAEGELESVRILNSEGKLVMELNDLSSEEVHLELGHLPMGMYFIQVESALGVQRKRVVKMK